MEGKEKNVGIRRELDEVDLKFTAYMMTIILAVVTVWHGIDIATGFLGAVIMAQTRDLYRSTTKKGGNDEQNSVS